MAPNLQQTYMTLANSKNKNYFEWDFVGRTLGLMYTVNPTIQKLSEEEKEVWEDAVGRGTFAKMLILDIALGMLNQMTESAYPDQSGQHPEFGEEIMELARHLDD
ncbi:MAG: hypothetical protein Q9219_000359 [cf. Caloplaca sp. 3 TL-2023]